jgi:hypothetical protein
MKLDYHHLFHELKLKLENLLIENIDHPLEGMKGQQKLVNQWIALIS